MEKYEDIPIVIIGWNNLFFVQKFIEQIRKLPHPIIIFDNNSEYEPLLQYYIRLRNELPGRVTIHLLDKNYGHLVFLKFHHFLPKIYVITDADLELNPNMPVNVVEHMLSISNRHKIAKLGLALDITEGDKFIKGSYGHLVYHIESGYYKHRIEDPEYELYDAPTDTTFSLINNNYNTISYRVAGIFTAKHLPWYDNYLRDNIPKDELRIWIRNNISSSILRFIDPESLLL